MDGQDYLDQISADSRPIKPSRFQNIISSKFFLIGLIFVIVLIIIIVIGAILSANKTDVKSLSAALNLHITNTTSIIKTYQDEVKSSSLRSSSASLGSVLSDTNNKLTKYLTERYNYNPKKVETKISDQATLEKDNLESELFEAKITGNLDRIYAHKMAYEISRFISEETKIYNSTNDDTLKDILSTSYNSLSTLYDNFNNFSETK